MALQKVWLWNVSVDPPTKVQVLFNPTEYSIDRGANYAELQVPGLPGPLLQFVRGEAETLSVELLVDGSTERRSVQRELNALRQFVRIDSELHAPPVCVFDWGGVSFRGVVTSLRERFQLFNENGEVLRARVTMSFKSYRSGDAQLRELRRSSPDRTRVRVVREGETLAQIANEAYGDPRLWRAIAEANGIDRPRFLVPGTALRIPAL